jgi:hypothetical protein
MPLFPGGAAPAGEVPAPGAQAKSMRDADDD